MISAAVPPQTQEITHSPVDVSATPRDNYQQKSKASPLSTEQMVPFVPFQVVVDMQPPGQQV